jgi:hypothetical protein
LVAQAVSPADFDFFTAFDSMIKVTGDVLSASGTDIVLPLAEIWADLD